MPNGDASEHSADYDRLADQAADEEREENAPGRQLCSADCGNYADGICMVCKQPFCDDCSSKYDGRRMCSADIQAQVHAQELADKTAKMSERAANSTRERQLLELLIRHRDDLPDSVYVRYDATITEEQLRHLPDASVLGWVVNDNDTIDQGGWPVEVRWLLLADGSYGWEHRPVEGADVDPNDHVLSAVCYIPGHYGEPTEPYLASLESVLKKGGLKLPEPR